MSLRSGESQLEPGGRRVSVAARRGSLGSRLEERRHAWFVGRRLELATFRRALTLVEPSVLFVSGEAGIGKTSLLREYQRLAEGCGSRVARIDTARLERSSFAASRHFGKRMIAELTARGSLAAAAQRPVLLIDDYHRLDADSETWLLEELLPGIPETTLIVVASRRPPPPGLSLDAGWASAMSHRRLAPLDDSDAIELLDRRHVPIEARASVLKLSGGHPLALALSAELATGAPLQDHQVLEVQRRILQALCPMPKLRAERLALGLSAVARSVPFELLEYVLGVLADASSEDPQRIFAWLSDISLTETRRGGLLLHPLIRLGLLGQLKRERRLELEALRCAIREFYVEKLTAGVNAGRWLQDLIFSQAPAPAESLLDAERDDDLGVEPATPSDHPAIVELLRRRQGDQAAAIGQRWLESHPHSFEVVRSAGVEAVLQTLVLEPTTLDELPDHDPAIQLVRAFIDRHPLEAHEKALLFRFKLHRDEDDSPSPPLTPLVARETHYGLSVPGAAYGFSLYHHLTNWKAIFDHAGVNYQECGRLVMGGLSYVLVATCWRERPLREVLLSGGREGFELKHDAGPALAGSPPNAADDLNVKVHARVSELGRRAKLTSRELQVLELLCLGESVGEIAEALDIRPRTVKFHQENILKKTGIGSRLELFKVLL